ncbi:MAG: hypothetical protein ABWZ25_02530 [Chitinophagaceae bacterium]
MTKNAKILAGLAVLAAGVATYLLTRNGRKTRTMHAEGKYKPHNRHVSAVFSRAKAQALSPTES